MKLIIGIVMVCVILVIFFAKTLYDSDPFPNNIRNASLFVGAGLTVLFALLFAISLIESGIAELLK